MARKKVKLAYIANDSARRATFKKRMKGLMKKVSELSTLCGVNACAIIYSPYHTQPEVWPFPSDAQRVLARFKSLPQMEQSKKMMNQEGFLRQMLAKVKEQLKKQQKENRECEMIQLMYKCLVGNGVHDVNINNLGEMAWLVEDMMKDIRDRIEFLHGMSLPPFLKGGEIGVEGKTDIEVSMEALQNQEMTTMEALQKQHWFMELISSQEHMGSVGAGMVVPSYLDDNSSWSNILFP
ncbi:hypothetical protein HHK36_026246 [Tetracentron sinense]|uniref:MADS-box domain-containing protein n=1 Tax=Tetracentron sinense TaxID=13715 RepID=A0A834YJ24_TETSI|nr:hypothetical protein HHK36_026246 [Tetracentron sinense]